MFETYTQFQRYFVKLSFQIFMKPISTLKSVNSKTFQMIFANIDHIFIVSMEFLTNLLKVTDLTTSSGICEILTEMGERFMCYVPYCSNHAGAKLILSLLSKPDIKEFLDVIIYLSKEAHLNPILKNIDLMGFLIKPVQRICKYPILLREMLKYTKNTDEEFKQLISAFDRMQGLVETINQCAKSFDGMQIVADIQNRFSEKINIANQNRFLVREDTVQFVFLTTQKQRKIFLFNDILILARKDWRDKHHVIEKTPLKDVRVCDIIQTGDSELFLILEKQSSPMLEIEILPTCEYDQPNRYIISFFSLQDKLIWLNAYKALVKLTVRSRKIEDVIMTTSSSEKDDENLSNDDRKNQKSPSLKCRLQTLEAELEISEARCAELLENNVDREKIKQLEELLKIVSDESQKSSASKKAQEEEIEDLYAAIETLAGGVKDKDANIANLVIQVDQLNAIQTSNLLEKDTELKLMLALQSRVDEKSQMLVVAIEDNQNIALELYNVNCENLKMKEQLLNLKLATESQKTISENIIARGITALEQSQIAFSTKQAKYSVMELENKSFRTHFEEIEMKISKLIRLTATHILPIVPNNGSENSRNNLSDASESLFENQMVKLHDIYLLFSEKNDDCLAATHLASKREKEFLDLKITFASQRDEDLQNLKNIRNILRNYESDKCTLENQVREKTIDLDACMEKIETQNIQIKNITMRFETLTNKAPETDELIAKQKNEIKQMKLHIPELEAALSRLRLEIVEHENISKDFTAKFSCLSASMKDRETQNLEVRRKLLDCQAELMQSHSQMKVAKADLVLKEQKVVDCSFDNEILRKKLQDKEISLLQIVHEVKLEKSIIVESHRKQKDTVIRIEDLETKCTSLQSKLAYKIDMLTDSEHRVSELKVDQAEMHLKFEHKCNELKIIQFQLADIVARSEQVEVESAAVKVNLTRKIEGHNLELQFFIGKLSQAESDIKELASGKLCLERQIYHLQAEKQTLANLKVNSDKELASHHEHSLRLKDLACETLKELVKSQEVDLKRLNETFEVEVRLHQTEIIETGIRLKQKIARSEIEQAEKVAALQIEKVAADLLHQSHCHELNEQIEEISNTLSDINRKNDCIAAEHKASIRRCDDEKLLHDATKMEFNSFKKTVETEDQTRESEKSIMIVKFNAEINTMTKTVEELYLKLKVSKLGALENEKKILAKNLELIEVQNNKDVEIAMKQTEINIISKSLDCALEQISMVGEKMTKSEIDSRMQLQEIINLKTEAEKISTELISSRMIYGEAQSVIRSTKFELKNVSNELNISQETNAILNSEMDAVSLRNEDLRILAEKEAIRYRVIITEMKQSEISKQEEINVQCHDLQKHSKINSILEVKVLKSQLQVQELEKVARDAELSTGQIQLGLEREKDELYKQTQCLDSALQQYESKITYLKESSQSLKRKLSAKKIEISNLMTEMTSQSKKYLEIDMENTRLCVENSKLSDDYINVINESNESIAKMESMAESNFDQISLLEKIKIWALGVNTELILLSRTFASKTLNADLTCLQGLFASEVVKEIREKAEFAFERATKFEKSNIQYRQLQISTENQMEIAMDTILSLEQTIRENTVKYNMQIAELDSTTKILTCREISALEKIEALSLKGKIMNATIEDLNLKLINYAAESEIINLHDKQRQLDVERLKDQVLAIHTQGRLALEILNEKAKKSDSMLSDANQTCKGMALEILRVRCELGGTFDMVQVLKNEKAKWCDDTNRLKSNYEQVIRQLQNSIFEGQTKLFKLHDTLDEAQNNELKGLQYNSLLLPEKNGSLVAKTDKLNLKIAMRTHVLNEGLKVTNTQSKRNSINLSKFDTFMQVMSAGK